MGGGAASLKDQLNGMKNITHCRRRGDFAANLSQFFSIGGL